jgi:hypothetical protein
MNKLINTIMFLSIILFITIIIKYYFSSHTINTKNYNRLNIDQILNKKTLNLPILTNDTDNVIEFNNSLDNQVDEKKRSFWDLIKNK